MLSLTGRCIVTTRPAGQATALIDALQALGAEVINLPVIAIEATDPAPLQQVVLDDYHLAFFVSPNAVEQALQIRPRHEWPDGLRVATVGPASRKQLLAHGFQGILCPPEQFDSEGVLALPEFSAAAVAGRKILILRGTEGRELLADALRERGAQVDAIACYQRRCAVLDPAPLVARFHANELAALVFSASEGLRYFLQIMGAEGHAMLQRLPCFAPHPRICEALREAGVALPHLTAPGDAGIAATLAQVLGGPPVCLSAQSNARDSALRVKSPHGKT